MNNSFAVICVTYNRCKSLVRLLNSLLKAEYDGDNVDLIISIDKGNNKDIKAYADSFNWPFGKLRIIKHSENLGLKRHILGCGNFLSEYDSVAVLEDDLIVSPSFYLYARQAVANYKNNPDVAGISLYSYSVNYHNFLPFTPLNNGYDVYFMKIAMSWGQVWMKDSWNSFKLWLEENPNFEDDPSLPYSLYTWGNKSWLKYHMKYCIKENKYFVYPYYSLTNNNSEIGTHNSKQDFLFSVNMQYGIKNKYFMPSCVADGVCYDGYYENEKIPSVLKKFQGEGICMNIYGMKRDFGNSRYVVSCHNLKLPIVQAFTMRFRPIETNLVGGNEGYDIFVYDTLESKRINTKKTSSFIMYKYLHNIRTRSFLRVAFSKAFISELFNSL